MDYRLLKDECRLLLGIEHNTTSHAEKLLSTLGALIAISLVLYISFRFSAPRGAGIYGNNLIVASMGASAVLLFAVPHGALSQPWPLLGGHLLSAFIGVSCRELLPPHILTAGVAVGLSVGVMYYLRCIHPPGGATALTAVIGGDEVYKLGYQFLLSPVLINVIAILLVAIAFNAFFAKRRYPAHLAPHQMVKSKTTADYQTTQLTQEDFAAAMHEMDSYFDITSEGLTDLLELAKKHAEKKTSHPQHILAGHYYSNGQMGALWSIRQVIDAKPNEIMATDRLIYKVVAGAGGYTTGTCLGEEFKQWARFEVSPRKGHWVKLVEGK